MEKTVLRRSVAARLCIVLAATALAVLAIAQGAAHSMASSAPNIVSTFAPWFAAAKARSAELALLDKDQSRALRQAKAALDRDATLVPAVRTLGQLEEGTSGDRLLELALRLSRRDLPTHMVLLQRAATKGDLDAVIAHYGQALRTNQTSWPTLLPPLAKAASDRDVLLPLTRLLAQRPQWLYPFYREWVKSSPDTGAMVTLSRMMDRRGQPLNRDVRVGLLARLIDARDWSSLHDELARARPDCGVDACIDGGFRRYGLLQPVDWSPAAVDRALVVRVPVGGDAYALEYSFSGPGDVLIARRLMLLPAGRYEVAYRADPLAAGGPAGTGKVLLLLACADTSGAVLSDATRADGALRRTRASVTAGCPAQWLTLRLVSDSSEPVSGRISVLRIAPARDDR